MKVTTERDRIRTVANRWRATYPTGHRFGPDKSVIQGLLDAIDPETATADDVARIIGNRSWTEEYCSECGVATAWTLMVGEEPDYESRTAYLCKACALQVAELVKAA